MAKYKVAKKLNYKSRIYKVGDSISVDGIDAKKMLKSGAIATDSKINMVLPKGESLKAVGA